MVLVSINLIEERPIPEVVLSVAPQPAQYAASPAPTPTFFTMQEVFSVKDFVTSMLLDRRLTGEIGEFMDNQWCKKCGVDQGLH